MADPSKLLALTAFRALSAFYIAERRKSALPMLKQQETCLSRELTAFYKQRDAASKHDKPIIENNMRPLQWEVQDVRAQIAVIESEGNFQ